MCYEISVPNAENETLEEDEEHLKYFPASIVIPRVSVTVSFAGTDEPKTINSEVVGESAEVTARR
jgi:hypothetical protein